MGKFLIHVIFSSNIGKPARFEEIMGKISAVFLFKSNKIKLLMVFINFHNSYFLYFLTCDELHLFLRIHQQEVVVVWREVHPFFQWWLTTGLRYDLTVGIFFLHKDKPSFFSFFSWCEILLTAQKSERKWIFDILESTLERALTSQEIQTSKLTEYVYMSDVFSFCFFQVRLNFKIYLVKEHLYISQFLCDFYPLQFSVVFFFFKDLQVL